MSSKKRQKSLYLIVIGILVILFFLFTCDKKCINDVDEFPIEGQTAEGFEDGTYCAEVDYYNPNTGKSSEYTLEVDVESNEVTTIYWGNGGWLDEDHFTPELLDEQGECSFSSDRGYEYTVQILGQDCDNLDTYDEYKSKNLPMYSFDEAVYLVGLTQDEIDDLNVYEEGDVLSENDLLLLKNYINKIRDFERNNQIDDSNINRIRNAQVNLQREIDNGYITNIRKSNAAQIITIEKKGRVYELEVSGNRECTMGTATFDENNYDWQMVYIKQYPNQESYKGYYMRIIL
ncbi:MAG: hypothetical protein FJX80_07835 [Bacteroidetes bacterium]|nr:hypothetical protein [Bacteroidota bacterium]